MSKDQITAKIAQLKLKLCAANLDSATQSLINSDIRHFEDLLKVTDNKIITANRPDVTSLLGDEEEFYEWMYNRKAI